MKYRFYLLISAFFIMNPVLSQWTDITSTIGGFSANTNMSRPYVFDVNNDNYPDVVTAVLTTVTSPYTKYWRLYKNNLNSAYSDVTAAYGLPTNLSNSSVGFIDYNGDTFKDLFVYTTTGLQVYRNNNGNSFTDVSASLGITANFFTATEKTSPMRVFDYDLDGDEDILYTRTVTGVNTLTAIVNNGTTLSTKANILSAIPGATTGGINFSFFDMDNDGDFDIVFDAYTGTSQYSNGNTSLFRKDNTVYTNTTGASGLVNGLPAEISSIDINQDGNLDIVKGGADCCGSSLYKVFIGNGLGAFTDQTSSYAISNGGYKGSATLSDFDNDKDFDFSWTTYTATGAAPFRLYTNNNNVFTETAATYGLNLGVTSGGVPIDDFGNGVWLDLDKDGDLDIIINREGVNSTSTTGNVWVRRNPIQGNYLNIRLSGCGVNKSGIGAKIKVISGASTRWLYYGNSTDGNASNGTDIFHFGLGASTIANSVTVYWPNNTTTVLNNVSGNQFLTIGGGAGGTSAPTGSASQTFCSGATVANLTATGSNIQWYAASTGGTALASNTALVNGTTYHASQTNNGCESPRLAVAVGINNPTVSASATTICSGSNVSLTANDNVTTTSAQTQVNNLVNSGLWSLEATYGGHYYLKYQTTMNWPLAKTLCEQNGGYLFCVNSQLENDNVGVPIANSIAYGDFLLGLYQDLNDLNYSEPAGGWKWLDGSLLSYTHWASLGTGWVLDEPSGSPGENYGIMDYNNTGSFWIDTYSETNGTVIMELSGSTSYLWSTGETTQTINVAPTSTTTYSCAVTTNGVTCTQAVTINVNSLPTITTTPSNSTTICNGQLTTLTANSTDTGTSNFSIGSVGPAGGYVFYDQGAVINGWRYLEVAPSDYGMPLEWGCDGTDVPGTATGIGTGQSNTNLIMQYCSSPNIAARACDNAIINGYGDWYLPSKDDFYYIYQNLSPLGVGDFINSNGNQWNRYWTSTQAGGFAYAQDYTPYYQQVTQKSNPNKIRPVRQFSAVTSAATYLWSTGETTQTINVFPTSTTTYSCAVTINGVTCSQTVTINVNPLPTATVTSTTPTTFCQGGSVVLNANTGTGLMYQWYNNAVAVNEATTSSYTAYATGSFTVVVTNTSTCSATSTATVVTVNSNLDYFADNDADEFGDAAALISTCVQPQGYVTNSTDCDDTNANINPGAEDIAGNGIDENCDGQIDNSIFELNASISLYPNPTRSELNVQVNSCIIGSDLYIFDAVGKQIHKQQILSTNTSLSVETFANGNYIVRIGEVVKRFEVMK